MAIGTTAALIMGGLAAGGSIGGAAIGSRAAGKAARTQAEAGELAALGIDEATLRAIAKEGDAVNAANVALDTGLTRATGVQQGALDASLGYVQPYQQAGQGAITTLADLMAPGGEFNKPVTMADLELDPGFEFRMQEGKKALEASAAARGTSLSGGALKELTRYSQGVASDEYSKAFDRLRAGQNDRFGRLSTLAGFGQDANAQAQAAQMNFGNTVGGYEFNTGGTKANIGFRANERIGDLGVEGAMASGNVRTGAANALAAGTAAQGNIWSNAVGNIGSSAADIYLASLLGKKTPGAGTIPPFGEG